MRTDLKLCLKTIKINESEQRKKICRKRGNKKNKKIDNMQYIRIRYSTFATVHHNLIKINCNVQNPIRTNWITHSHTHLNSHTFS